MSARRAGTRPPRARAGMRLGRPARRLRAGVVVLVLVLAVVGLRLVQLQGLDASAYAADATTQREQTLVLPAARGTITDRSGTVLARDVDVHAVFVDQTLVTDPNAAAAALAPILSRSASSLVPLLTGTARFRYLARGVESATARQVSLAKVPGVGVQPETRREYPAGSTAANVVGFTETGGGGLAGIEAAYDSTLAGTAGSVTVQQDPSGRRLPGSADRLVPAEPGRGVRLTLSADLQYVAQQALAQGVSDHQARGGTVVVMDPRTGEVLAMASAPTLDSNNPGASPAAARGNAAVSDVYEPGSTNKVITMAAAIDSGVATAATPVTVPPTLQVNGQTFRDAEVHGEEHLTLAGVLAKSSNIGTVLTAQQLGPDRLEAALRAFGLGAPTGVGFPGESAGLLPPTTEWSGTSLATISFGQGMSATALQMANVYATIANGGERLTPRLVDGVEGPDGFLPAAPGPKVQAVTPRTARVVSDMLEAVTTDEGTAPLAAIPGYRVAGKTGTAYRAGPDGRYSGYTSSFVGYAPADQPRLVVAVILDDPTVGYFGGTSAAPVFRQVMSYALRQGRIPPTGTTGPVLPLTVG